MKADKSIKRNRILKLLIQIALIAAVLLLVYFSVESVLPGIIDLIAKGDGADVQQYLSQFTNLRGCFIGFLLQFIQIITIFLPSIPIQIAMGIVFGVWRGFLICFLGYNAASALIFAAARKLGDSLEKLLPSKKVNEKGETKKRAILDSEHPAFMVFLATLFPMLPNGLIPYAAAKTKVRFPAFMLAVGTGCIPTILTLCAVGKKLIGGDFLAAALFTLPLLALFIILFWQQKNITALFEKVSARIRKRRQKKAAEK